MSRFIWCTKKYYRGIFDNISIQYLVIIGLIGLGTKFLTKKIIDYYVVEQSVFAK